MKIYINNRNFLTWPKKMSEILLNQGHDVYIVDNASTYEPLLEWYNQQKDIKIIKLGINSGHNSPWTHKIIDTSDYYVVTDPDLDISTVPSNWDEVLISGIKQFNVEKAGLSLSEKTYLPVILHGYWMIFVVTLMAITHIDGVTMLN